MKYYGVSSQRVVWSEGLAMKWRRRSDEGVLQEVCPRKEKTAGRARCSSPHPCPPKVCFGKIVPDISSSSKYHPS